VARLGSLNASLKCKGFAHALGKVGLHPGELLQAVEEVCRPKCGLTVHLVLSLSLHLHDGDDHGVHVGVGALVTVDRGLHQVLLSVAGLDPLEGLHAVGGLLGLRKDALGAAY
jgi:hypothetical protein